MHTEGPTYQHKASFTIHTGSSRCSDGDGEAHRVCGPMTHRAPHMCTLCVRGRWVLPARAHGRRRVAQSSTLRVGLVCRWMSGDRSETQVPGCAPDWGPGQGSATPSAGSPGLVSAQRTMLGEHGNLGTSVCAPLTLKCPADERPQAGLCGRLPERRQGPWHVPLAPAPRQLCSEGCRAVRSPPAWCPSDTAARSPLARPPEQGPASTRVPLPAPGAQEAAGEILTVVM